MSWEHEFLKLIQKYNIPTYFDKIMRLSSLLTDNGIILIIMSFVLAFTEKYKKMGYLCMASLIVNAIICNALLKPIIARVRPFDRYVDLDVMIANLPTDFSFPSGHTSAAFAFATSVFLYDKRLGLLAYIFAMLVAMSRMYLLVHYPTDVLGGCILGITVALLCNKFV